MNNDNITFVKFYKNLISDYDHFISCDYVFQICVRNKYRIIRFREKMYIFLLFMNFFYLIYLQNVKNWEILVGKSDFDTLKIE